ncbi:MAG: tetratricopeptide repeat protein [Deltaproteobacteria bacterium]|nr:tetratricopeptide repeat protein [Deltaproteobacteria bacterium]
MTFLEMTAPEPLQRNKSIMKSSSRMPAIRLMVITVLIAGGIYYGISCNRDRPEHLYSKAIDAAANGNVETAENIYKLIIKRYPNSSVRKDALYQLGLLEYLYLNDYTTALEYFYDLVYTYPHYKHTFDAYMYIAQIYQEKQHLPQKAIEVYEKLLSSTSSEEYLKQLLPRLASEYEGAGNIPKAISIYDKLLKLYPKPPASYLYEFAYLNYLAGHYSDAVKDFQKISLLYPQSSYEFSAQLAIADCYEETGKSEEALSLLNGLKSQYPSETSIIGVKIDSITQRLKNKKK